MDFATAFHRHGDRSTRYTACKFAFNLMPRSACKSNINMRNPRTPGLSTFTAQIYFIIVIWLSTVFPYIFHIYICRTRELRACETIRSGGENRNTVFSLLFKTINIVDANKSIYFQSSRHTHHLFPSGIYITRSLAIRTTKRRISDTNHARANERPKEREEESYGIYTQCCAAHTYYMRSVSPDPDFIYALSSRARTK